MLLDASKDRQLLAVGAVSAGEVGAMGALGAWMQWMMLVISAFGAGVSYSQQPEYDCTWYRSGRATDLVNGRRVHVVVLQQTAGPHIIHLDRVIGAGRRHAHAVRVEGHVVREALGLVEHVGAALGARVPDADGAVVRGAGQETAVRREPGGGAGRR